MIMIELLNNPPATSISAHRISIQNHSYCCSIRHDFRLHFHCTTSCSSYVTVGLKTNTSCTKKNANRRFPKNLLPSKSIEIHNSHFLANKVARLEFEPAFTEVTVPILKEKKEENREIYLQQNLRPWVTSSSQDSDDQYHSNSPSKILSKTSVDETEADIYYLEERDELILSERLLKLSRSNKIRSALALYRSMELSSLLPKPHSCNSLLSCLLRNGRLDDAMNIFKSMKSSEIITSHTYSLLLKAVARTWDSDAALSIFEEAQRDENTKKHIDVIVYNTMITIYGKVDNWVQVESLWRSLQENHLVGTVVTYRLLVCIFVRSYQNELAIDAYHEMIRSGLNPTSDAMEAIIGACTREGKWDMALNVMHSMLSKEMKPSLVTCNALINSLGKAAKVDLAFKVHDLVKKLGYVPDAYTWNALIGALNRANRHGDALLLFERINNEEHGCPLNLHTYNTCLVSCQRLGLWEKALQLLWQMEAVGLPVSVTSYNLAIGACEVARKPKVALRIYEHMIRIKQSPDVFTPLSLIRVCIWGSLWDEVEEILNSEPNVSLYNAAIQGMCLRKKTDMARKLYVKMREIGLKPDGKTRALMLQNLPEDR